MQSSLYSNFIFWLISIWMIHDVNPWRSRVKGNYNQKSRKRTTNSNDHQFRKMFLACHSQPLTVTKCDSGTRWVFYKNKSGQSIPNVPCLELVSSFALVLLIIELPALKRKDSSRVCRKECSSLDSSLWMRCREKMKRRKWSYASTSFVLRFHFVPAASSLCFIISSFTHCHRYSLSYSLFPKKHRMNLRGEREAEVVTDPDSCHLTVQFPRIHSSLVMLDWRTRKVTVTNREKERKKPETGRTTRTAWSTRWRRRKNTSQERWWWWWWCKRTLQCFLTQH